MSVVYFLDFLMSSAQRLGKVSSSLEKQQHKNANAALFTTDSLSVVAEKPKFDKSNPF